jgi:small nuclear ribonucleoprotein (snRNP)-like protein
MKTNVVSAALIVLVANLVTFATLNAEAEKEQKYAQKVKAAITKLGSGPEACVKVQLRNNTKVKGYIRAISESSFTVVDCFPTALAQNSINDWANVRRLSPGINLYIAPKTGRTIKGRLVSVNDAEIVIRRNKNLQPIDKNVVTRIYIANRRSGKRAKNIGTGIGLVTGLIIGSKADENADWPTLWLPASLAFGTAGYFLGKWLCHGSKKGLLVYEAQ